MFNVYESYFGVGVYNKSNLLSKVSVYYILNIEMYMLMAKPSIQGFYITSPLRHYK